MFSARAKAAAGHMCLHAQYVCVKWSVPLFLKRLKQEGKTHDPDVAKHRPRSGYLVLQLDLLVAFNSEHVPNGCDDCDDDGGEWWRN